MILHLRQEAGNLWTFTPKRIETSRAGPVPLVLYEISEARPSQLDFCVDDIGR